MSMNRMKSWQRGLGLALAVAGLWACSDDKGPPDDADVAVEDGGAETSGDAVDASVDVPAGTLQWRRYEPSEAIKMRAVAAVPGKPGHYVIVGDEARVWRFDGSTFSQLKPTGIGQADLFAVWVAGDGTIVVGGAANSLLTFDGSVWQPAPVNPAQPVTFRAIAGGGGQIWAVGDGRAAWRHDGTTWLAETVTVTAGDGAGIAAAANFVGVDVDGAGEAWIAADQGAASAAVVVRQEGGKWLGASLALTASDIWLAPGADKDPVGNVLVAGGVSEPLVAIWDGKAFAAISSDDLNWKLGFNKLAGLDAERVWVAGLKGQLRRRDGKVWQEVNVKSAPGVVPPFSATKDLYDVAVHGEEELLVLSAFNLHRFGVQP